MPVKRMSGYSNGMSRRSLLIRLLLMLCLVVSTTAGAASSVRMHLAMAMSAHSAPATTLPHHTDMAAETPCHQPAMAAADDMDLHAGTSTDHPSEPGAPDCCQGGLCDTLCLLSLPPLSIALQLPAVAPDGSHLLLQALPDHTAPRLPQPQRPPIA